MSKKNYAIFLDINISIIIKIIKYNNIRYNVAGSGITGTVVTIEM